MAYPVDGVYADGHRELVTAGWSSDTPSVLAVVSGALLTAKAPGNAIVTASACGQSAQVAVSVTAGLTTFQQTACATWNRQLVTLAQAGTSCVTASDGTQDCSARIDFSDECASYAVSPCAAAMPAPAACGS
jgi:hypothetical protein